MYSNVISVVVQNVMWISTYACINFTKHNICKDKKEWSIHVKNLSGRYSRKKLKNCNPMSCVL